MKINVFKIINNFLLPLKRVTCILQREFSDTKVLSICGKMDGEYIKNKNINITNVVKEEMIT